MGYFDGSAKDGHCSAGIHIALAAPGCELPVEAVQLAYYLGPGTSMRAELCAAVGLVVMLTQLALGISPVVAAAETGRLLRGPKPVNGLALDEAV